LPRHTYEYNGRPSSVQPRIDGASSHVPDHTLPSHPVLAQGRALELIVGDKLLNGIMSLESRIRQILMDAIAQGTDLLEVFRRFDVNRDGHIEQREIVDALQFMGLCPKKWGATFEEDITRFIDSIDSFDGIDSGGMIEYDRSVDYQEFIKFVMDDLKFSPRAGFEGVHPANDLLEGKRIIGLFFGSSWAPQTVKLADSLERFYRNLKQQGDDSFEVIYVSHDQDQKRFLDFYKTHPWLAIPFEDRERRHYMEQKLMVTTLPRLVLFDSTGALLSYDAKFEMMDLMDNPKNAMRRWKMQNYVSHDRQDKPHHRHMGGAGRLSFIEGRRPITGS